MIHLNPTYLNLVGWGRLFKPFNKGMNMNRKYVMLIAAIFVAGCTYKGEQNLETYIDEPATILRDPHFTNYEQASEHLESQYLQKKISYAEYLEKKKELDDQYSKEVQKRDAIISSEK